MPAYPVGLQLDHENFTFDRLREVLAVGAASHTERVSFVLQSLECYRDGFVAHLDAELQFEIPHPSEGFDESNMPPEFRGSFLAASAVDDRGNTYSGGFRSADGGGGSNGLIMMHLVHTFAPALDEDATALTLIVHLLERTRTDENGQLDLDGSGVLDGPWHLTFPVRAAERETSSVVPVGQQVRLDDVGLTVFSIERTASDFSIVARLDWTGLPGHMVHVGWEATDDFGGTYRTTNCSGAGGGSFPLEEKALHPFSWRMKCIFARPIDPEASRITLKASKIAIVQPVWDESGPDPKPEWPVQRQVGSPGQIVVDLA